MNLDTANLLHVAEEATKSAGVFLKAKRAKITSSISKDIKIDADRDAHGIIVGILDQSGIPILSEEDAVHDFDMELKWIVDPLDGSFNFLRGMPSYAVSICLAHKNKLILGVVYDFNREELFTGIVGKGAWLNGEKIVVSNTMDRKDAVIMSGFPSYTDYSTQPLQEYIKMVQDYKKVRLIGSAALSLAYVACGRADAYYEKDIKIWDVAGGLALIEAAGGWYSRSDIDSEGKCTISATNSCLLTN